MSAFHCRHVGHCLPRALLSQAQWVCLNLPSYISHNLFHLELCTSSSAINLIMIYTHHCKLYLYYWYNSASFKNTLMCWSAEGCPTKGRILALATGRHDPGLRQLGICWQSQIHVCLNHTWGHVTKKADIKWPRHKAPGQGHNWSSQSQTSVWVWPVQGDIYFVYNYRNNESESNVQ